MPQAQRMRSGLGLQPEGQNRDSIDHYDTGSVMLKLARVIAERANTQESKWYEFRFCLPTGTRIYRDLRNGTLVPFKKIKGEYIPVTF